MYKYYCKSLFGRYEILQSGLQEYINAASSFDFNPGRHGHHLRNYFIRLRLLNPNSHSFLSSVAMDWYGTVRCSQPFRPCFSGPDPCGWRNGSLVILARCVDGIIALFLPVHLSYNDISYLSSGSDRYKQVWASFHTA